MYITIESNGNPRRKITVLMGRKPGVPKDGYGGWVVEPHPKKKSTIRYDGADVFKMSLPIVLDGWSTKTDQSLQIAKLEALAAPQWRTRSGINPRNSSSLQSPPPVVITGPMRMSGASWVINDIAWDEDAEIRDETRIFRAEATLSLLESNFGNILDPMRKTSAAQKQQSRDVVTLSSIQHQVKSGQTLTWIANHYHVEGGWQAVAEFQNPRIRDPKSIKKGQMLKIPLR